MPQTLGKNNPGKTNNTHNVYIDVENTLNVPFISGIQRVTRELVNALIELGNLRWSFVPVSYCDLCKGWIQHDKIPRERVHASSWNSRAVSLLKTLSSYSCLIAESQILRQLYLHLSHPRSHQSNLIPWFEPGSIFLDMDSSWHNTIKRSVLLPKLENNGVRIVTLHHDLVPLLHPELTHVNTVKVFTNHFDAHLEHSSLFICNSNSSRRSLVKYVDSLPARKCIQTELIRFGDYEVNPGDESPIYLIPDQRTKYLLYVATIEARKNHALLLDAFDNLADEHPNLGLVLVGRQGWLSENIVNRISSHPHFDDRVFWFVHLSDSQLSSLYRNAFLSVSTSHYEGYGLPISEALSHKCVTICSNAGALPEIAGNYAEYFNSTDLSGLTSLIERYLLDSEMYRLKKQALHKRCSRTWESTATELVALLDKHFFPTG